MCSIVAAFVILLSSTQHSVEPGGRPFIVIIVDTYLVLGVGAGGIEIKGVLFCFIVVTIFIFMSCCL